MIDLAVFGAGQEGRCLLHSHAIALEHDPAGVVNDPVENGAASRVRECFMMHLSLIAWSVAVGVEVDQSGRWKG